MVLKGNILGKGNGDLEGSQINWTSMGMYCTWVPGVGAYDVDHKGFLRDRRMTQPEWERGRWVFWYQDTYCIIYTYIYTVYIYVYIHIYIYIVL